MEETNPLLDLKSIECDVWILLPIRYTDRGAVPKRLHLSLGPGKRSLVHVFKSTEAVFHHHYGQIYVIRVKLNANEMSECSVEIWDDDTRRRNFLTHTFDKESLPTCIKLLNVPPMKENEFWNDFRVVNNWVFNHHNVLFRTDAFLENMRIIENNKEESIKRVELTRDTPLFCKFFMFNAKLMGMSSFNQVFESDTSDTMESVMNMIKGVDFSPFRLPLQSRGSASDSFAKALEDVREAFVTSSNFSRTNVRLHEELKRNFDLKFLKLSNLKANNDKPYFIVHDDRKNALHFVKANWKQTHILQDNTPESLFNHFATVIYDQMFSFRTTNKGLQEAVRKNWIKYQCLQGQDDEFNIFRSLCFAPPSNFDQRYHIGFVALSLQILLCIGITLDSVEQWSDTSLGDVWETIISLEYEVEDTLIVIISTLTFAFILQRLSKTINSFKRFYRNMKEVCIIPKTIIVLDFTSNVVVGTWMAMITPFFLLQSEDIQTVVLNSFALTIFIELDDLANVFESDEAYLLQEDAHGMERMRMDQEWIKRNVDPSGVVKREIGHPWTGCRRFQMLAKFCLSPFYESLKILISLIEMCCRCKYRNNKHWDTLEVKENPHLQVTCGRADCNEVLQLVPVKDCYASLGISVVICECGISVDGILNPDHMVYHCGKDQFDLCEDCAKRKFISDSSVVC